LVAIWKRLTACAGRVKLSIDFSEIKIAFRIPAERPAPNFAPSWNVAPTDSLPIVRYDPESGERLGLMQYRRELLLEKTWQLCRDD
jgi:hypothetical protein